MPTAFPLFRLEAPLRLCAALALCMILAISPGCNRAGTQTPTPEERAHYEKMNAYAKTFDMETEYTPGIKARTQGRFTPPARFDVILSDEAAMFWQKFNEYERRVALKGQLSIFQEARREAGIPPSLADANPEVRIMDERGKEIARINERDSTLTP